MYILLQFEKKWPRWGLYLGPWGTTLGVLSLLQGGEISPTQDTLVTQAALYPFPLQQIFWFSTPCRGPGWVLVTQG